MEELSFIEVQTNTSRHLQKQEWHLSTSFNTFFSSRRRTKRSTSVSSQIKSPAGEWFVGVDFDMSISENSL